MPKSPLTQEILGQVADKFDRWMKDFADSHREAGHNKDNNKALVSFLSGDRGFRYIKSYDDLCQLAVVLRKRGYNTTNPPCKPIDFAHAIEHAHPESFGDVKPVMPKEIALQLAADKFDRWMKDFADSHREAGHDKDNNKALVSFLSGARGFRYIKSYDDLRQVAVLLQRMGYNTTNPPCKPIDFAHAIEHAHPKSFGDVKPVVPKSAKKLLRKEQREHDEKMEKWIERRIEEVLKEENQDKMIAKGITLGLICNSIFNNPRNMQRESLVEEIGKTIFSKASELKEFLTHQISTRTRRKDGRLARDVKLYADALAIFQSAETTEKNILDILTDLRKHAQTQKIRLLLSTTDSLMSTLEDPNAITRIKEVFTSQTSRVTPSPVR